MVNIAVILKKMGKQVSGCDIPEEFPTDIVLTQNAISFETPIPEHLPENIDTVVYAAAHKGDQNSLVLEAKEKGIQVIHQAELLGELLGQFAMSIAVAGCHGKTTTSSLLAYALIQLGKAPSYLIGAPSFGQYPGGDYKENAYFVIEADEYGINPPQNKTPKFHYLKPSSAIITNIDFDHPDVYTSLEDTKHAFKVFIENITTGANALLPIVVCSDNQPLMDVMQSFKRESYKTYGTAEGSDYLVNDMQFSQDRTIFYIERNGERIPFTISLYGEKNVLNAAGVISWLMEHGFDYQDIQKAILDFTGAKRRFEQVYHEHDIYLFDDYAHHPVEIEALVSAVRNRFDRQRVILLFQPHTFSRTSALEHDFITALSKADISFITPIFGSAREHISEDTITSHHIQAEAEKKGITNIHVCETTEELLSALKEHVQKGDIVVTAGAGDIYKLKNGIIELINSMS